MAAKHLFTGGVSLSQTIQAFAATIDTAAWVVLLLLFELETFVLDDDKIKGPLKWTVHGVRALCYLVIIYAFYGYSVKCFGLYQFAALPTSDLCTLLADSTLSFMVDLDEFVSVGNDNCTALGASNQLFGINSGTISTDAKTLAATIRLAWVDVINSAAWLLVVLVLEIDIRLQLKGQLEGSLVSASKMVKAVLYTTLVAAAVYWGFAGDFVDFWDAFLWIVAFVFIEMNMFEWNAETTALQEAL
ncbi:MAG: hypothetical protein ACR2P1_19490 [Pseudomonadales bacterium]